MLVGACNAPEHAPSTTATSAAPASVPPSLAAPANNSVGAALTRTFDAERVNAPPAGFSFGRTGTGAPGRWVVFAEPGATSGAHVLAQLDADVTNFRFPVAVMTQPLVRDVRVSVRCKMVSGRVDQACGLVARYQDENDYVITRANALEGNIRLYTVRDAKRSELASFSGRVAPNVWHEYRLELRGDQIQVFWNGQRVLDHQDATFSEPGRVGVWTKADSITYFDDLRIEPL